MNSMRRSAGLLVAVGFAALLAACGDGPSSTTAAGSKAGAAPVQQAEPPPAVPVTVNSAGLPDFSGLVDSFGPAVVNVATVGKVTTVREMPGFDPDDPMQEFFKRFGFGAPNRPHPPLRGEGSGFIVTPTATS